MARLKPPSGGPARLYERARLARVRELLGPTIGPQLLELIDRGERIELVLAGRGWENALESERETLARRIARRLGRAQVELVVRSRPDAEPVVGPAGVARRTQEVPSELPDREEMLERLARLGARFAERARDAGDER